MHLIPLYQLSKKYQHLEWHLYLKICAFARKKQTKKHQKHKKMTNIPENSTKIEIIESELNGYETKYHAPERLVSPTGLLLTEEQTKAVEKLVNWALEAMSMPRNIPVRQRSIRLEGVPGAGKSTILMTLIREINRLKYSTIIATAPTHKAKRVLIDLAVENAMWDLKISTLQSQLGIKARLDDFGEDEFVFDDGRKKIHENDLVLSDEASMINDVQWEYLNRLTDCPPIIFSCDRDQLKPVESNEKSPIFKEVKRAVFLTKPMRYGGVISDYVTALRKSSTFVDPTPFADGEKLIVVGRDKWFELLIQDFSSFEEDMPSVRALAYTNKGVRWVNNTVHYQRGLRKLGYTDLSDITNEDIKTINSKIPQYEPGIDVIFKKTINEWDRVENKRVVRVHNSTEAKIVEAHKTVHEGYGAWFLNMKWYDVTVNGDIIPTSYQGYCLDSVDLKTFNDKIAELKEQIAPYKNVEYSPIKSALKRDIARHRDFWINWNKGELTSLTYTYSSTIHTGQGSGWKYVFPLLPDIVKCQDGSTLKELIYTCMTRAKEKLIIMI